MTLTAGFSKPCESVSGGVLSVWLANAADIASLTLTGTEYSAITMVGVTTFYKFEFSQDSAEVRQNTARGDNGNVSVTHELEFYLPKMSTIQRDSIQEIVDASPCGVVGIAKDANGNQWVLGYNEIALLDRPLRILSGAGATGKAFTDSNGTAVILNSVDGELHRNFTGTVPV